MNMQPPLPKGMKPPVPEQPEVPETHIAHSEPLTHEEVNYSKLIRQALANVPGVDIIVHSLSVVEDIDESPKVTLDLEIERGESAHD